MLDFLRMSIFLGGWDTIRNIVFEEDDIPPDVIGIESISISDKTYDAF